MATAMRKRAVTYSTVLPRPTVWNRRMVALAASIVFHICLVWWLLQGPMRGQVASLPSQRETAQPIQLAFAPPRPTPTPRPAQPPAQQETREEPPPAPPAVPLTPGPDPDPGSTARVTPTPEKEPNAPPETPRTEATRPDPSPDEGEQSARPARGDAAAAEPTPGPNAPVTNASTTGMKALETEARRLFGRGPSRLGALAGRADNRPWESATSLDSRGCTLPPPDPADSTVPAGMAAVEGKIYREDNGQPLAGARLQILGTAFGTFSNDVGEYRLVFDRSLVDRCRTQSVRVSAPGYAGRDVILYIGEPLSSDVPLRRY